jgi:NRAMP (natural resistance-associated macrophage protein)-like metal ion transporter
VLLQEQPEPILALRRAIADRHLEQVRTLLTTISPDQAMVVLDELAADEQADLATLIGPDELRDLLPRSTPDDEVADAAERLAGQPARRLRLLRMLGPGLVTGASGDDPSGIATYSVAGAQFGFATLWTALLTFPFMVGVQYTCGKLGFVTGMGLAGVLRKYYPRSVVYVAVTGLLVANTINAGADLGAVAAAVNLLVPSLSIAVLVAPIAVIIVSLEVFGPYWLIARVFKWLTLTLLAYVAVAFFIQPSWSDVIRSTFIPTLSPDRDYLTTLVAILGTTISPYMFFWQTSHYIEEQVARGRIFVWQRLGGSDAELRYAAWDVGVGMLLSNVVMYFIILAAGATLHAAGKTDIRTAADAAQALRPVAGDWAEALLAIGVIGSGMLAVPVLLGSGAYAVAEAARWRYGLGAQLARARRFYALISVSALAATAINYMGINVIDALYWSSVINGVLAGPLLVLILLVANNRGVMGHRVNGRVLNLLVGLAAMLMCVAAVGLFVSWVT